jgi:hypothetical protein
MSTATPGCVVFVLDQSHSMNDQIGTPPGNQPSGDKKRNAVADALNRTLYELVLACTPEDVVKDRLDVAVIGYGATVGSALGGSLANQQMVTISAIADDPVRVEPSQSGGNPTPIWIDDQAAGGTPMCEALRLVHTLVGDWISQHSGGDDHHPPIVVNITDGEATDGDPTPIAAEIRSLATRDGNVLLFNAHLSHSVKKPCAFPDSAADLPDAADDQFAEPLFEMSSVMPAKMRREASSVGYQLSDAARGFVFNADVATLVHFLDIGTRVETNVR